MKVMGARVVVFIIMMVVNQFLRSQNNNNNNKLKKKKKQKITPRRVWTAQARAPWAICQVEACSAWAGCPNHFFFLKKFLEYQPSHQTHTSLYLCALSEFAFFIINNIRVLK